VQIQERTEAMSEGAASFSLKEKESSEGQFLGGKVSLYE